MNRIFTGLPATAGIYKITNNRNGYFYIGSAVSLRKRWSDHKSFLRKNKHHNPRLQAAWNKYGSDIFEFTVMENVSDVSRLLEYEQKWIDNTQAAARRDSYNFCAVAGSQLGRKRSAETCKKLSQAMMGKVTSPEAKAKQRAAKLGKRLSPQHRENLSLARIGVPTNRPKGIYVYSLRKFTGEQVRKMRKLKQQGWSFGKIQTKYGVSHGGLQKIIYRQTYDDIE